MDVTTEKRKMLAGELYSATDPELVADHLHAQNLLYQFNATRADATEEGLALLMELFGHFGRGSVLKPSFRCDYGYNILIGRNVFVNYDCVFLDCNRITIGDACKSGRLYRSTRRSIRPIRRLGGPGSNSRCR